MVRKYIMEDDKVIVHIGSEQIYSQEEHSVSTENPLNVDIERLSTQKVFDDIRLELKQIYNLSEKKRLNNILCMENEEIINSEDTPYTMSLGNSRRNTWEIEDSSVDKAEQDIKTRFHQYSYHQVEESLVKYYKPSISKLDILMVYLNGQKHIYLQSYRLSVFQLNSLYFPSLMLTSFTTFFAPFSYLGEFWWTNLALCLINGVILVLIALISFLKLESAATLFFQLYSEYEKINTGLEFFYNRMMEEGEQNFLLIQKKNDEIEMTVQNLKNYFSTVIPKKVQDLFPILSHINVFAFIKKMEEEKTQLIHEFWQAKNEIRYIELKQDKMQNIPLHEQTKQNKRIHFLLKRKEEIKLDLIEHKNAYGILEKRIMEEINHSEKNANFISLIFSCNFCIFNAPQPNIKSNKIIDEYLTVFAKS